MAACSVGQEVGRGGSTIAADADVNTTNQDGAMTALGIASFRQAHDGDRPEMDPRRRPGEGTRARQETPVSQAGEVRAAKIC